ncbi:MAG: hypothetical protein WC489_03585 [Patescibacteria group bacterium]
MDTHLSMDTSIAFKSQEKVRAPLELSGHYQQVLDLNINAQTATHDWLLTICEADKIPRSYLRHDIARDLGIVADSVSKTYKITSTPKSFARKPRHINIEDEVIDPITSNVPSATDFVSEVRHLLAKLPGQQPAKVITEMEHNLLCIYVARIIDTAIAVRSDETSLSPNLPDPTDSDTPLQAQHARQVMAEIKEFGIDTVRQYYSLAEKISFANSSCQIETIVRKIEQAHLSPNLETALLGLAERTAVTLCESESQHEKGPHFSKRETAKAYIEDLRQAFGYIDYLTPDERKGYLSRIPPLILELLHNTRTLANLVTNKVATSNDLRKLFWQLRNNRDIAYFIKQHPPLYAKPADFGHYQNHLYDRVLRSEAAGFEYTEKLRLQATDYDPDVALPLLVQRILEKNRLDFPQDGAKPILFTVVFNEHTLLQVHLNPRSTEDQIRDSLQNAKREKIKLTPQERAELTFLGYQPGSKRWNNKMFRELYGHGLDKKTPGDYLIHISTTSQMPDRMNPQSVFHVGLHKAAFSLHLGDDPNLTAIFNHRSYDGIPAKKALRAIAGSFSDSLQSQPTTCGESNDSYLTLQDILNQDGEYSGPYPIPEGVGMLTDSFPYQKLSFRLADGHTITLSPTDVRAIVMGLANDIDHLHNLHNAPLPPDYSRINPTHNNIQPIVVGIDALRRILNDHMEKKGLSRPFSSRSLTPTLRHRINRLFPLPNPPSTETRFLQWMEQLSISNGKGKTGGGAVATISAVTGTRADPLGALSSLLHPVGTEMLNQSGGLFSSIFDPKQEGETNRFTTAHSTVYSPKTSDIDLEDPKPSLGVIGYNQEGRNGVAVTTCRKFPSQAQVGLRAAILGWFPIDRRDGYQTHSTLRHMTKLIQAWDTLAHGNSSLASYQEILNYTYDILLTEETCGSTLLQKNGIQSAETLQVFLNKTLRQTAQDTLDPDKIRHAYEVLLQCVADLEGYHNKPDSPQPEN